MASYGQLVGQPSYSDDSALFDRQAGAGESSRAASSTPALKITVTDPLKKVDQHLPLLLDCALPASLNCAYTVHILLVLSAIPIFVGGIFYHAEAALESFLWASG
jgi:hypothetical protein